MSMENFPQRFASVCDVDTARVSSLREELDESIGCCRETARYADERSRGPGRKTLGAALLVVPAVQSRNAPLRDGAQGIWPLRVARPGCPPTSHGITRRGADQLADAFRAQRHLAHAHAEGR